MRWALVRRCPLGRPSWIAVIHGGGRLVPRLGLFGTWREAQDWADREVRA